LLGRHAVETFLTFRSLRQLNKTYKKAVERIRQQKKYVTNQCEELEFLNNLWELGCEYEEGMKKARQSPYF
jgi:hypothetical protein